MNMNVILTFKNIAEIRINNIVFSDTFVPICYYKENDIDYILLLTC